MTKPIGSQLKRICWHSALLIALLVPHAALANTWQLLVGAQAYDRANQALGFLPNEIWIHAGDSIRWTFPTQERHTLTFLTPGQVRPPLFGAIWGVEVGCPGTTPDGSDYDGSTCCTRESCWPRQIRLPIPYISRRPATSSLFAWLTRI